MGKQRNDILEYGKYVTRIPDVVSYEICEWHILQ